MILWLEGPMQSWGTRSRWDVRDTRPEPTKSGVVGLIGCALGLERGNQRLESLDRSIRFGVRIDRPGIISTDYHTVTGYHRTAAGGFKHSGGVAKTLQSARTHGPATIVSPRSYLHDAAFLVALAVEGELAAHLKQALRAPRWPLFLGRKSCPPIRPILEDCAECAYASIADAVKSHPRHPKSAEGLLEAYIEDETGNLERQDALRINRLRFYDFRNCRHLEVDPPCFSPA
ncbi:MAG: type I-E CRISPR-associated protein Cas5/CasD [Armatimonadetes bacterium]|nr:type I-E CRISPR-associated protein Cas5/CasD [Armatimonadota bacterium]